jgi:hypothetical protein
MARCCQCNLLISGAAEHCPRCGHPLPSRFLITTRWVIIIGLLIVVFGAMRAAATRSRALPNHRLLVRRERIGAFCFRKTAPCKIDEPSDGSRVWGLLAGNSNFLSNTEPGRL